MLVQLNKCVVVCDSDLQREVSFDGCLSLFILFKYEGSIVVWCLLLCCVFGC